MEKNSLYQRISHDITKGMYLHLGFVYIDYDKNVGFLNLSLVYAVYISFFSACPRYSKDFAPCPYCKGFGSAMGTSLHTSNTRASSLYKSSIYSTHLNKSVLFLTHILDANWPVSSPGIQQSFD